MSNNDKLNKLNKVAKGAGGIATGITMVASVLPLLKPAIDTVRNYADKSIEERKKLVTVPELYSKEYPLTIEQAIDMLNSYDLKATLVKATITDANIKYRTCFDSQVIKTQPKARQKVERGTSILVKYITQDVIDESQRLFENAEKQKADLLVEKNTKRSVRKEKTKQVVSGITDTVKQKVAKLPSIIHNKNSVKDEEELK